MSKALQPYGEYKESDIDWLGEIPAHWTLSRVKEQGSVRGRVGWKALKADEYVDEGYVFLSTPNIKNRNIDFENVNYITYERYIESPEIILKENDILLAKDGSTLGIANIVTSLPREATVNSSIAVLRFRRETHTKYLFYQFLSDFIQVRISFKKNGMGVPHLFQRDINAFILLLPPIAEQKAIAHYLDTKTAQIDRKIDLLTQKAQRHEELKRAIVNETVTRGLDKSVPMKDSAIEWIGKIPEHWEVNRLKDIARQSKEKNGNTPIGEMLSVSGYRGIEFKKYDDELKKRTDEELSDYRVVRPGQLVVNTMWLNYRGIGVSKLRGYVSPAYRAYFLNKTAYGTFIHYLMRSDLYVSGYSKYLQGIRPNSLQMKTIDFECLPMLVPPLPEQEAIAHYLDTKTAQIDQIIQTINTQIENLKELRKTLINDVVIGKIKVT